MMENFIAQSLLSIIILRGFAFGSVEYCKHRLFDDLRNKNVVRFSKENSEREYAIVDEFKTLHCCSTGYRSIEWFKDGVPYPWSTNESTLIISPESRNQTIYSPAISKADSGRYWCIVRNDGKPLVHRVYLTVSEWSDPSDPPKATYKPKDQFVRVGQNARFYCEAFIGNVSVGDDRNGITWSKLDVNYSISDNERIKQEIVFREGNQVVGCYLTVNDVRLEDYGEYGCRIVKRDNLFLHLNASLIHKDKTVNAGSDRNPLKGTRLLIFIFVICAKIAILFAVYFRSRFRNIYERFFPNCYSNRTKLYDILVVYHEEEKDIALNKIVFGLQNSYHFTCNVHPVTFGKLVCKDLIEKAGNASRVILLLTPALAESDWSARKLSVILDEMIGLHPRIITVLLSRLPVYEPCEDSIRLGNLLQRVFCVEYSETKLHMFWDMLRLGLPAPRATSEVRENVDLV